MIALIIRTERIALQQFHRNTGTSFGIGEGVVVMLQMVTTGFCDDMQLVVGQIGKTMRSNWARDG